MDDDITILDDEEVLPSAARTVSGSLELPRWGGRTGAAVRLAITAAAGTTPTLNVVVEDRDESTGAWGLVDTFPQKIAAGSETRTLPRATKRFVRVRYTIAGTTPSFTFSVMMAASAANLSIQKTG